MSGPDCVWCGMTINAHREHGPAAKTPCGMLKRGFVAAPENQRSVGDVPAPTFGPETDQRLSELVKSSLDLMETVGKTAERAAVVKYLRQRAESCADAFWRDAVNNWALVIEHGEHL